MQGPMAGGEGELMARKCSIRGDYDAFAGCDRGAPEETSKADADRRRDAPSEASRILGANIVAEREALGLTREDLARSVGMSVEELAFVEEGRGDPEIFSTVARIADGLQVDLPVLLRGM